MSSYDPEFQDQSKAPKPGFDPTPKRNGCWFYGCVFVLVSGVVLTIGLAVAGFLIYRSFTRAVEAYTSPAPMPLPKVEITEAQKKSALERAEAFRAALKAKTKTKPLVLTGDDLNALVQETPKLKDRVYLSIEDDAVKARVSLPVDEFFDTGFTRGRYFNAEAQVKASLVDGKLKLAVESVNVGGKPLPDAVRDVFAKPNIILDAQKNKDQEELLQAIESIEIKDGAVVITPRSTEPGKPSEPPVPKTQPQQESSTAKPDQASAVNKDVATDSLIRR